MNKKEINKLIKQYEDEIKELKMYNKIWHEMNDKKIEELKIRARILLGY